MSHPIEITDEYRYYLLRKRHAEELILRAFRRFRENNIEPILIKGWAAARNYPQDRPRFFSDIDLAVSAADYEKTTSIIAAEPDIGGIDLHRELRRLDTVDWNRVFSNSQLVPLDNENIRILCPEDHLRVLCVHWLMNGGENRERLWDIVYAIQNRPANFDWSKCLDVVNERRRQWIIMTIGIAHKYMGLELNGIPFAREASRLPDWLTRCLEREWSTKTELLALQTLLMHPGTFLKQVRKRIPPNPIQATIDCDGVFDDGSRVGYQIRDTFIRLGPSVRRISSTIFKGKW
jgi:hypothetical protein